MRCLPPITATMGTSIRDWRRPRLVNAFQQLGERILILETGRRRPRREGAAKRSGDSRLVGQAVDTDELAFHLVLGCVLVG